MKFKINYIFFLAFLLVVSMPVLKAQKQNNTTNMYRSIENKAPKKSHFINFLSSDKDAYYILKEYKKQYAVEKIDNKLVPVAFVPFDVRIDNKSQTIERTLMFNENLYLVIKYLNKSENTNELYLQKYNTVSLKLEGDPQKVASIQYDKKKNSDDFSIYISSDGKRMLIYSALPHKEGEAETFSLNILDQDLKNVWSKNVILPYLDESFSVINISITPTGSVIINGTESVDKNILLVFNNHSDKPTTITLKLENDLFTMRNWTYDIGPDGNIIAVGFYTEKNNRDYKGTFCMFIDPVSGKVLSEKTKEFDLKALMDDMPDNQTYKSSKKKAEDKKTELLNYYFRRFIVKQDGGFILLAENYSLGIISNYNQGTGGRPAGITYTYQYHYNNIMVIDHDKDGNVNWVTIVPKNQSSSNDGGYYSSFSTIYKDKQLHLVYNDFTKGGDTRLRGSERRPMPLVAVTINENGKQNKEMLFNQVKKIPRASIKYSYEARDKGQSEMLLYAYRKKKFQYTRLVF